MRLLRTGDAGEPVDAGELVDDGESVDAGESAGGGKSVGAGESTDDGELADSEEPVGTEGASSGSCEDTRVASGSFVGSFVCASCSMGPPLRQQQ